MRALRVFISSPADVAEERIVARGVTDRLQGEFSGRLKLEIFFWEEEPLLATADFQTQIESPAGYDIFVSILWSRLGSPLPGRFLKADGSRYDSGTEYEYEMALSAFQATGKPHILVYRKTAIATVALDDEPWLLEQLEQKRALERFLDRWFVNPDQTSKGAYHTFGKPEDFETIFEVHLRKLIDQHLSDSLQDSALDNATWIGLSPFRGLNVFEYEHAAVFFGRTRAVAEILDALRQQAAVDSAFVLILGMSGGGKSSIARAGVVPMLTSTGVIKEVCNWARAVFSPAESGIDPIEELVRALAQPDALPALFDNATEAELVQLLRSHPESIRPLVRRSLGDDHARLVLVVDQLEEIFTHEYIDRDVCGVFVRALRALASTGLVWIIATLRSDFYPHCSEYPDLMALKDGRGQYDLAPPTPVEIAQMIRFPARAAGLRFDERADTGERLDDVLRDQASRNPEMLPLLEFTLEELYQRRSDAGVLTFLAYEEIGGLEGSIARRAEHVFEALPSLVQAEFSHTMDRLITRSLSDRDAATRLGANIHDLSPSGKVLVNAFVDARLFVTELDEDENIVGRIAHEALIKYWPRIQHWLADNEENLRLHARLTDATERWLADPSNDLLLPHGKPLEEARLLHLRRVDLLPAEHNFMMRSEQRVKRNRRLRSLFRAALVTLTIGTAVGAGVAVQQSQIARVEADTAKATTEFLVGLFQVSDPWTSSRVSGVDITAGEILDRGAEQAISQLTDQPRVQANFLHAIGGVYQGLGMVDEANQMYQKALVTRRQLLGDDHLEIGETLQGLAFVAYAQGEYVETERLLREAIDIRRAKEGEGSLSIAFAMNLMSVAVANQDRLEEAIEIQTETMRIMDSHDNVNFLDRGFGYNNLGYVMMSADRYDEAMEAFEMAVSITDETNAVGLHSRALANLAAVHQVMGHLEKARLLHEQSLALKRDWFELGHSEIGYSLNNLAWVARAQGDFDYSITLYEEALQNFKASLGDNHQNVAVVRGNLAKTYQSADKHKRAVMLYREALARVEARAGPESSNTLPIHIGLGQSYERLDRPDKALFHFQRAVEIGTEVSPEGWHTGIALANLASLENSGLSRKDRDIAFEKSLVLVTQAAGDRHEVHAHLLMRYARHLDATERSVLARNKFTQALDIENKHLGDNHADYPDHLAEFDKRFAASAL